jgi:hypothetical protein
MNRVQYKVLLSVSLSGALINAEYINFSFVFHKHFSIRRPNKRVAFLKRAPSITIIHMIFIIDLYKKVNCNVKATYIDVTAFNGVRVIRYSSCTVIAISLLCQL